MSYIEHEIIDRSLVLRIPENRHLVSVCSGAVLGGGIVRDARYIVNHTIPKDEWFEDPRVLATCIVEKHGLPVDRSVVLITSVKQQIFGYGREVYKELAVEVFATVGLGNALAAGDEAEHISHYTPGTINIMAFAWGHLTDEALIQSISIMAEAKSLYLFEQGVKSKKSNKPATGTGTDCAAITSLGGDIYIPYAGKHGKFGELLAKATISAIDKSVKKRTLGS